MLEKYRIIRFDNQIIIGLWSFTIDLFSVIFCFYGEEDDRKTEIYPPHRNNKIEHERLRLWS